MTNSNHELRQAIADYAWNAWACLGVAGWRRRGFAACIDIDALVLLTGRLGDGDARLRDESLDWCASNLEYVARSRLVHLLKDGGAPGSWGAYAATLQHATKQSWPGSSQPFGWHPSGKSRLPQHADGATLALRARALFGATARAEAIRILMLIVGELASLSKPPTRSGPSRRPSRVWKSRVWFDRHPSATAIRINSDVGRNWKRYWHPCQRFARARGRFVVSPGRS